mmetsp:Transcript_17008/g.28742  ORF Transcript_17008/g.28742 Transcript_17008/m.28742 type:complete len:135 (-) Transcript_17008:20-424(-)
MKYLEANNSRNQRGGFRSLMNHQYLWTPTPSFYIVTVMTFLLIKERFRLNFFHLIPMMMIPVTVDFVKREAYVSQVAHKERERVAESRLAVRKIMEEKKRNVTFEQVVRYVLRLNLDKPIDQAKQRELLPLIFQ